TRPEAGRWRRWSPPTSSTSPLFRYLLSHRTFPILDAILQLLVPPSQVRRTLPANLALGYPAAGGLERRRLREVEGRPRGLATPGVDDHENGRSEGPVCPVDLGDLDSMFAAVIGRGEDESIRLERERAPRLPDRSRPQIDTPDRDWAWHSPIFSERDDLDHNRSMTFVDETLLFARAGRGGDGSAHLHSEPYKPRGGPDGGDGGPGGRRGRRARRREAARAGAPRGRRRGSRRTAERRQVDASFAAHGRAAEDRGVPVHHADPQPRRRR